MLRAASLARGYNAQIEFLRSVILSTRDTTTIGKQVRTMERHLKQLKEELTAVRQFVDLSDKDPTEIDSSAMKFETSEMQSE